MRLTSSSDAIQQLADTPPSQLPHPATTVPPQPVATPPVMPPTAAAPALYSITGADLDAFANDPSESSSVPSLTSGSASGSTAGSATLNSAASLGDQSLFNDVLDAELGDELFDGLLVDNELVDGLLELADELAGEPAANELADGIAHVELVE